jgi:hypothetical protein
VQSKINLNHITGTNGLKTGFTLMINSLYKIFHPEIFQGTLKKKNYFEGWYFKHVSADGRDAFAVIPGISLSDDSHSFIQYIDGNSGKTSYFRYPKEDFIFSRRKFEIQVGESAFTENGVILNLKESGVTISGKIIYTHLTRLPKTIMMPGIMGWYSYVPTMECNHGMVSAGHELSGSVEVNGVITDLTGGNGYIEKDWGTSFPESWIWLQCNNFDERSASVMISIAKIPWRGSYFMGFVAFFAMNGKIEVLATWNGSAIGSLKRIDQNNTEIILRRGSLTMKALVTKKGSGTLKAPSLGMMENIIKESLNSEVFVEIRNEDKHIFEGHGIRAGYEETDKIFTYFPI